MSKGNGITVTGVEVANFHRLTVARVELVPGVGLVRVTGKNGSGKTSLLRSVKAALGGQGEVLPHAVVNDDSEDGTGEVRLELSNGYTVVRRFTEANPKGYLTVVGPDGGKHGQGKLAEWLGPLSFDPLSFFDLTPKRQNEILLSLGDDTLPRRLAGLRAERETLRVQRTPWINRKRDAMKVSEPEGERPTPISTVDELERMGQLQADERAKQDAQRQVEQLRRERDRVTEAEEHAAARVAELEQLLSEAKGHREELRSNGAKLDSAVDEAFLAWDEMPDPADEIAAVKSRIAQADEVERALRPWEAYERAQADVVTARDKETELTRAIEDFDRRERELVASVGLPVEGLTFTEDGPQLNGRPLSVASGAERIRLAVAVALTSNPDLRICLVDEANDIDLEGLAALDDLAKANDFQIWACRLGLEGHGEIVVDDGRAFDRDASPEAA